MSFGYSFVLSAVLILFSFSTQARAQELSYDVAEHAEPQNVTSNNLLLRHKRDELVSNSELLALALAAMAARQITITEEKICKINVKTLEAEHALIVDPKDHTKFLYPDENGFIVFKQGEAVFLSCSGEGNTFTLFAKVQSQDFLCVNGVTFTGPSEDIFPFNFLTCHDMPQPDIVDEGKIDSIHDIVSGMSRITLLENPQYHKYKIGFHTDPHHFLKLIDIVYDDDNSVTWYTKAIVSKAINGGQTTRCGIRFNKKYYSTDKSLDMDEVYKQTTQDTSFGTFLDNHWSLPEDKRFLRKDSDYLFNRGHLTPQASMVYLAAACATRAYLNTAPQWRRINRENGDAIEGHINLMARMMKKDLVVYTGVHGHERLEDSRGLQPAFLYAVRKREYTETKFPIPLYIFKLVIEPESKKGVVYVTVNNPYIGDTSFSNYHLCKDLITEQTRPDIKFPKNWKPNNKLSGYSYMCTVDDFRATSGFVPLDMLHELSDITELLWLPKKTQKVRATTPAITTTTDWEDRHGLK